MYFDLRDVYWLDCFKMDIAQFVSKCPNFQKFKDEHLNLSGIIQDMGVPTWKWEEINMDFFVGLP